MKNALRRRNPSATVLDTLAEIVPNAAAQVYRVRTVNPGQPGRKPSAKKLLATGSVILDRLSRMHADYAQDGADCWGKMQVAYQGDSPHDRRTALTCLQLKLTQWTAEDANVAGDSVVQQYRKTLHGALDH